MDRCSHKATCRREGKIVHACVMCDFELRTCGFHREQVFKKVQAHIMAAHPHEYSAVSRAPGLQPAAASIDSGEGTFIKS